MLDALQFSSFSEFIDMGGYAFNVWSVYGLFALFVAVNLIMPVRKRKQILREQKRRLSFSESENNDEINSNNNEEGLD
ncbi:MAG: heme exporter protein CcmD [SAR86 cluster bacterium]|uniref:Heme exporter protein D n=1 Tax=SAR86 cluster bacterium TaxID=2030880 RepID=A0A2A5AW77_9GAMM|nr:MAG: heme exporter protein CcmD [SAR86 cluster bacterium]